MMNELTRDMLVLDLTISHDRYKHHIAVSSPQLSSELQPVHVGYDEIDEGHVWSVGLGNF
jgi:hypothetical protein